MSMHTYAQINKDLLGNQHYQDIFLLYDIIAFITFHLHPAIQFQL